VSTETEGARADGARTAHPLDVLAERALLRAAVESGLDGLVVVSAEGRMLSMNHQFVEMWPIPPEIASSGDDEAALASAMQQLVDPDAFLARVHEIYADPSAPTRDELLLQDGRVFDRYGTPLRSPAGEYLGWAWYFRDVTAERRAAQHAIEAGERFRRLARTLQESLLPPHLPDVPGLEIAARYLPGSSVVDVVGDFYDVFQTSGDSWALTIGDVCGKGVEAATVTALARYTIRAAAVTRTSPAQVLRLLNEAMRRQHPDSERFVTATYVTLVQDDGAVKARLSLAGHPPALLRRADGTVEAVGRPGTVLGVLDDVELADVTVGLHPGDSLVLYTDGVTESRRGGELFGEQRLTSLIAATVGNASAMAEQIETEVVAFSEGRQHDDTAILVVRVPDA
jgi:serine phosphatase RsbU (regulator of sigma subunit)